MSCILILFVCLFLSGCASHAKADAPVAVASSGPSAAASVVPAGTGGVPAGSGGVTAGTGVVAPSVTVTPAEAKQLLKEFQKAQSTELKALAHRNSLEMKELRASQTARTREWENKERDARHKYFAEHPHGPERRAYVQDFVERHKAFDQILADERLRRVQEQDARLKAIKVDQSAKLKEFQDNLKKGLRPPARLWPDTGH